MLLKPPLTIWLFIFLWLVSEVHYHYRYDFAFQIAALSVGKALLVAAVVALRSRFARTLLSFGALLNFAGVIWLLVDSNAPFGDLSTWTWVQQVLGLAMVILLWLPSTSRYLPKLRSDIWAGFLSLAAALPLAFAAMLLMLLLPGSVDLWVTVWLVSVGITFGLLKLFRRGQSASHEISGVAAARTTP